MRPPEEVRNRSATPRSPRARFGFRPRIRSLTLLLFMLAEVQCQRPTASPPVLPARPNIVLITMECVRSDHLRSWGYSRDTMPNIEAFFRDGIRFQHAVATSSWTLPSMISLFSSMYPYEHGVTEGWFESSRDETVIKSRMPKELRWLPVELKKAGYATFGFTTSPHLIRDVGFNRGFDHWVQRVLFLDASLVDGSVKATRDKLLKELPVFLWIHYFDPHWPYFARNPWIARYCPHPPQIPGDLLQVMLEPTVHQRYPSRDNPVLQYLVDSYDSELNYLDAYFKELLGILSMPENTIYVVTADHGEEFLEHGHLDHGHDLHGELVHVPLFLKWPAARLPAGQVDNVVSLIDVAPTLLELSGVSVPPEFRGESLRAPLLGVAPWNDNRRVFVHLNNFGHRLSGVETQQWKLVRDDETQRVSFYDKSDDPGEERVRQPARYASTSQALLKQLTDEIRGHPRRWSGAPETSGTQVNSEMAEQLKAMGYVK
jgi:arylsulfatase A-like enzyme